MSDVTPLPTEPRIDDDTIHDTLAEATAQVNAGETAKLRRAAWVKLADAQGWTQTRIAAAAGISQPAVSKILKDRPDDDLAYQVGRLLGLAAWIAQKKGAAYSYPYADKILGGGDPVTQITIQKVHREIKKGRPDAATRRTYEEITARIAELGGVPPLAAVLGGVEEQSRIILGYHHQRKDLTDGVGQ